MRPLNVGVAVFLPHTQSLLALECQPVVCSVLSLSATWSIVGAMCVSLCQLYEKY